MPFYIWVYVWVLICAVQYDPMLGVVWESCIGCYNAYTQDSIPPPKTATCILNTEMCIWVTWVTVGWVN